MSGIRGTTWDWSSTHCTCAKAVRRWTPAGNGYQGSGPPSVLMESAPGSSASRISRASGRHRDRLPANRLANRTCVQLQILLEHIFGYQTSVPPSDLQLCQMAKTGKRRARPNMPLTSTNGQGGRMLAIKIGHQGRSPTFSRGRFSDHVATRFWAVTDNPAGQRRFWRSRKVATCKWFAREREQHR